MTFFSPPSGKERLMRSIATVVTLAVLAAGFAPAPFPRAERERDPNKVDLARLQGTWEVANAKLNTGAGIIFNEVTIRGTRMVYRLRGQVTHECSFCLDARSGRMHETSDNGDRSAAAYRFSSGGDELTCAWYVRRRTEEPPALEPGHDVTLVVYRRVRR
jgi:hypothetical protein